MTMLLIAILALDLNAGGGFWFAFLFIGIIKFVLWGAKVTDERKN